MLENFVQTPDYLTPSTSSPFAAVVVSILIIAALLWILAPRATSQRFSLTRKCGIAVAFFVLALSASASFAGQRKGPIPALNGLQRCEAEASKTTFYPVISTPCAYDPDRPKCPETKNGGTCDEAAFFKWKPTAASTAIYTQGGGTVTYSYCTDALPNWNGSQCVVSDQCSELKGKTRSSGFHDYGKDKTKGPQAASCEPNLGCLMVYDGNDISHTATVGGETHYFAKGKYIFAGSTCQLTASNAAPAASSDGALPPNSCGPGQRLGQVNGRDKCVNVGPPSPPSTPGKAASESPNGTDVPKNPAPPLHDKCWQAFGEVFCYDFVSGIGVVGGNGTEGDPTKDKPMPGDTETPTDPTDPDADGKSCGAPGQPKCGVTIDETGVSPALPSGIAQAKTAFETAYDTIISKFAEVTSTKQWGITWSYQLPSGSCTALQFGAGRFQTQLDICKPLGYVRDLWSYVMYVMTGLYIWRSARDAMNVI